MSVESSQLLSELGYQDVFQARLGIPCFWTIISKVATAQHYPITGVHTGINNKTGARPMRRNINEFQKDIPTWHETLNPWNV